jgi:hypothetical protein
MAGRQQIGAEVLGGVQQIDELHVLVAGDAGNRRLAGDIGARERLDHLLVEAGLVIEHIMRHAEARRDIAGVVDVLPCAARALAMRGDAVIVKLHRQSDDVVTLAREQCRHDAGVDAARHRDDDARVRRRLGQAQGIERARRSGGSERSSQIHQVHPRISGSGDSIPKMGTDSPAGKALNRIHRRPPARAAPRGPAPRRRTITIVQDLRALLTHVLSKHRRHCLVES